MIPTIHGPVQVSRLRIGSRLELYDGKIRKIVKITTEKVKDAVRFRPHAFDHNIPSSSVIVTRNHLIKLPGRGFLRADQAMQLAKPGFACVYSEPGDITVYHLGLNDWSLVRVSNLLLETLAWKDEHHLMRPGLKL